MSEFIHDFNPASHFTTGTAGPPGQRTFYLQIGRGIEYVSMICEKEQMHALGEGLLSLLDQIAEQFALSAPESRKAVNFDLIQPVIPTWRIAQLGVGYDDENDYIVIIVQELVEEDQESDVGRFTITRALAHAFAYHALEIVSAGRPHCLFCGEPIDPEGHFCSRTNGHDKSYVQ